MFERYTESARRSIFFARYEASNYGSPQIGTEHLLLGILRERRDSLAQWFPEERNPESQIRAEIEKRIIRGESLPTSVEIPLTLQSREILSLAGETADTLGHRPIEPEHLLIAMLRMEKCLAAQVLSSRGIKADLLEKQLAKAPASPPYHPHNPLAPALALSKLNEFLASVQSPASEELIAFFASNAEIIDASGNRWTREEMNGGCESLFASYAKKNAAYIIEETVLDTNDLFISTVLWKNALLASEERSWMQRMTVFLACEPTDWRILFIQVTPVRPPSPSPRK